MLRFLFMLFVLLPMTAWAQFGPGPGGGSGGGGGGTPGGSNGQVQYNSAGIFGGFSMTGDCTLIASTGAITCSNLSGLGFANGSLLYQGVSGVAGLTDGTPGQLLLGSGVLTSPSWQSMNGDALISGTGALTISKINGQGITLGGSLVTGGALNVVNLTTTNDLLYVTSAGHVGQLGLGTNVSIVGGVLNATGGVSGPGTTTNLFVPQWNGITGAALSAGLPVGLTGNSTIVETTSSGLLTSSILPPIPISSGVSGLGTGIATALGINIGTAGAPILLNGAGGTPSSLTLTNATGLPLSGIASLGTGIATALGINVGTPGTVVILGGAGGTPSSLTLTNATGLPFSGLPTISNGTVLGNISGVTGVPGVLNATQVTTLINVATRSLSGAVPAPGGSGTVRFLREDLTFATPAGGGNVTGPGSSTTNDCALFADTTGTLLKDGSCGTGGSVNPGTITQPGYYAGTGSSISPYTHASMNTGNLILNFNAAALPAPLTGTVLQLGNADTTLSRVELDGFGATPTYTSVAYGGTAATPLAVTTGTQLGGYRYISYIYIYIYINIYIYIYIYIHTHLHCLPGGGGGGGGGLPIWARRPLDQGTSFQGFLRPRIFQPGHGGSEARISSTPNGTTPALWTSCVRQRWRRCWFLLLLPVDRKAWARSTPPGCMWVVLLSSC